MIVFLTVVTIFGLSLVLLSAFLLYIVQDTVRFRDEIEMKHKREDIEGYLNIMEVSSMLFRVAYWMGYVLVLGGIGMFVYKIF